MKYTSRLLTTVLGLFIVCNALVLAQTTIPGPTVSGEWTLAGSPYLIQASIMIPTDSTLTIDPGVTVSFQTRVMLLVQGRLLAVGTAADTIYFTTSDTTNGFKGIRFNDLLASNDTSKLIYCKIQYGKAQSAPYVNGGALYFNNWGKAIISHCTISNCKAISNGGAISCDSSSNPVISYNSIFNNSAYYGGGIYCDNGSSPAISNNTIFNNLSQPGAGGGICCVNSSNPAISNNTITYNSAPSGNSSYNGGGICCDGSSPAISNNIISHNSASSGGGIWSDGSNPTITNNTIFYNTANYYGAGIYCGNGSPTITNNTISNNSGPVSNGGGGIHIDNCSIISPISYNTITNNSADNGGGSGIAVGNNSTVAAISYNTITNNSTGYGGGGIYCSYSSISSISYDTISNNYTNADGGGIYCIRSTVSNISNITITNNSANTITGNGGGLYCTGTSFTMTNVTIANNSANQGGALFCDVSSSPTLRNCILWGNTATTTGAQLFLNDEPSDPNFYYCDVQGGTAAFGLNGNFYTGSYSNNLNIDPKFVSPSAGSGTGYNGVTADWSLQGTSPCIDAGDPGSPLDPDDTRADIGAFYYYHIVPPPVPTLVAPANGATNQPKSLTLRWNSSATATSYRVQLGTDSNFVTGVFLDDSAVVDTFKNVSGLVYMTQYYWRVNARKTVGTSAWSGVWGFTSFSGTYVQGNVSGTWTEPNSPYIVIGQATVPAGQTLTIQPGVLVKFDVGLSLTVNGILRAIGLPGDSIAFTTTQSNPAPGEWGQINVTNPGSIDTAAMLQYCVLKYGGASDNAVLTGSDVRVLNSTISQNSNGPVIVSKSSILSCTVSYNAGVGIWPGNGGTIDSCVISNNGVGINMGSDGGVAVIRDCMISGNGVGIASAWYATVIRCVVERNSGDGINMYVGLNVKGSIIRLNGGNGLGHVVGYAGDVAVVDSCVIAQNALNGIGVSSRVHHTLIFGNGGAGITGTSDAIENNTVIGNTNGIIGLVSGASVRSNIIAYNSGYGLQTTASPLPAVGFNDLFQNGTDYSGFSSFYGNNATTNHNADLCDFFSNISFNPHFLDSANQNYHLTPGSKCIDAGDTLSPQDPDSTIADIGAFYYDHVPPPALVSPANGAINQPTTLTLQWNHSIGATSYRLQVSAEPNFVSAPFLDDSTVVNTFRTVSGLANDSTYFWRVRAKRGSTPNSFSAARTFTTRLAAPNVTAAVLSSQKINLSWGSVNGAVAYKIYRSTDSVNYSSRDSVTSLVYADNGLTADTHYWYRLAAVNTSGLEGDTSSAASAETKLAPPVVSTRAVSSRALSLSWGSVAGAAAYRIYRSADSILYARRDSVAVTVYADTGLTADTRYWYRLTAVKANGEEGDTSNVSSAETKLAAPVIAVSVVNSQKLSVGWASITGAATYKIYRSTDGTSYSIRDSVAGTAYTDSGLAGGTPYWYRVIAAKVNGEAGDTSNTANAVTDPTTPFGLAPVSFTDSAITLNWSSGGGLVARYRIYRSLDSTTFLLRDSTSQTTYTDTGLTPQTKYWYKVTALNSVGVESDSSNTAHAKTRRALAIIFAVMTPQGTQHHAVKIGYALILPAPDTVALLCFYSTDSGKAYVRTLNVSGNLGNITASRQDTLTWQSQLDLVGVEINLVRFKIVPVGQSDTGKIKATDIFTIDNKAPVFGGLVSAVGDTNRVRLTWMSTADMSMPVLYSIYRSTTSGGENLTTPDTTTVDTTLVLGNLLNFQRYYFVVRAQDSVGNRDTNRVEQSGMPIAKSSIPMVNAPVGAQRGDVHIVYGVNVPLQDSVHLVCRYSTDGGSTFTTPQNVTGHLAHVTQTTTDSLVWRTANDYPNESPTMQFMIVPVGRGDTGVAASTKSFIVDNKAPVFSGLQNAIWDTNYVKLVWTKATDLTQPITYYLYKSATPGSENYSNADTVTTDTTLVVKNLANLQTYYFVVRAQDAVGNIDTNRIERSFTIPPLADFSGDGKITAQDLSIFAKAWQTGNLAIGDIGPATGTPPNLQPQRDGKIDFEDLVVFGLMWNWSLDQPDAVSTMAKLAPRKFDEKSQLEISFAEQPVLPPKESKQFSLQLSGIKDIQTLSLRFDYDVAKIQIDSLLISGNRRTIALKNINKKKGYAVFAAASLDSNLDAQLGSKGFARIFMTALTTLREEPVHITAETYSSKAKCTSETVKEIDFNFRPLVPESYALTQNYPNPFNPSTRIEYQLPSSGLVTLEVYNVLGQEVMTLVNAEQKAGYYEVQWDGISSRGVSVSSGIYFYRFQSRSFTQVKKMLMLK